MERIHKSCFLLVLSSFFLGGCQSMQNNIDDSYNFSANPEHGLLSFSTRWDFRCPNEVPLLSEHSYFNYKDSTGTEDHRIILHNPFSSSDFDNPPGNIHLKQAKSGKYSIEYFDMTNGHTRYMLRPSKPITFTVESGKVNYIGQLNVQVSSCGEKFIGDHGLPDATLTLNISDQWARDKKMLMEDYPTLLSSKPNLRLMKQ